MVRPRHELEELIHVNERRCHELERQAAMLGVHAPPHVRLELDDLRAEIERPCTRPVWLALVRT